MSRVARSSQNLPSDGGLSRWKVSISSRPISSGGRPMAISIRRDEPYRFMASGKSAPLTRSKSSAGPSCRMTRWTISATSNFGSTSAVTRSSSPRASR